MDPQSNQSNAEPNNFQVPPSVPTESTGPATTPLIITNNNNTKNVGPIIGIFVVIIVLIILAIYLFASNINRNQIPEGNSDLLSATIDDSQASVDQTVQPITNTSDDVQSIQDDLNNATNGINSQNF